MKSGFVDFSGRGTALTMTAPMSPTGLRELPASRYNLNTYFGRVRVAPSRITQANPSIVWISRIHGLGKGQTES